MKTLIPILLACLLASCAAPIPRAIIAPDTVVAKLNTKPVEDASKATREAVREVVKAGQETRTATQKLRDEIDRAEKLAQANEELREAFTNIQRLAKSLSASLQLAEAKELAAIATIDSQEEEISLLKANAKAQAVQIEGNAAEQATLRKQVKSLARAADDLAIAKDKAKSRLKTIWKLSALCGVLVVLLFRKPIGLLLGGGR